MASQPARARAAGAQHCRAALSEPVRLPWPEEFFSDGITEELLNTLAGTPGLRVAARTSSFAFKGREVPADSIGRALRVAHLLEGSVRQDGATLRVTAQLIDAATGYHVWSETYDRPAGAILAVQDEISLKITLAAADHARRGGPGHPAGQGERRRRRPRPGPARAASHARRLPL